MPKLTDQESSKFVKMLVIGDSGTGKTGALTSLVKAGYKVRVLDMDNGLDILRQFVMRECPDKIGNVDYETLRDTIVSTPMGPAVKNPKAYIGAVNLMNKWSDDTSPQAWGEDTIFVLDTMTALGNAAYEWAKSMNPAAKEPRTWFYVAQQSIEMIIAMLTGADFKTNVIVISHIAYKEFQEGVTKGYASSVGSALGPKLQKYFNTVICAESVGAGKNVKRRFKTVPTGMVDLKTPVPFKIETEVPLETGLAELFTKIKEI